MLQSTHQTSESNFKPPKPKKPRSCLAPAPMDASEPLEQRSFRKSTLEVSEEFRRRMQEEEELRILQRSRKSGARKKPLRRLTQKELLAEARRTEVENLASLEAYARLEAEKKKVKEKRNIIEGPFIRFHSVTMPSLTEPPDHSSTMLKQEDSQVVDADAEGTECQPVKEQNTQPVYVGEPPEPQTYCRNFLIFTDTISYPAAYFPASKQRKPKKRFCPVTGLPARYTDPITGTPYATSQAFRIIRNRYISEGEQKCEKRLLQLSNWLEEKKRKKMEAKSY